MFTPDLETLQRLVHDLDADLDLWDGRPEGPSPRCRRAANEAMEEIDKALAELHTLRGRLSREMREFDEATAKRVDAMLAAPKLAAVEGGGGSANPLIAHPPAGSWNKP